MTRLLVALLLAAPLLPTSITLAQEATTQPAEQESTVRVTQVEEPRFALIKLNRDQYVLLGAVAALFLGVLFYVLRARRDLQDKETVAKADSDDGFGPMVLLGFVLIVFVAVVLYVFVIDPWVFQKPSL